MTTRRRASVGARGPLPATWPASPIRMAPGLPGEARQWMAPALAGVVGFGLVATGWFGSSGTADWSDQLAWTVVGGIGVMIYGLGATFWLLAGFQAVRTRSSALANVVASHLRVAAQGSADGGTLVIVRGGSLLHAAGCPFVEGKAVNEPDQSDLARLARCGACGP